MPRYRKLHVKATESLDINEMPDDFHRLLWVMLPLGLDREGRGIDNPAWVKAKIMPLRADVTHEMVNAAFCWFEARGMLRRYRVDGRCYFCLPSFAHYQGPTIKEAQSEYPAPPQEVQTSSVPTLDLLQTNASTDADSDADSDSNTDAAAAPQQQPPARPSSGGAARIETDPDVAFLFQQVDRAGVFVNGQLGDEQWRAILDVTRDHGLIQEAFTEAADSSSRQPSPKLLRKILERCVAEGCRPGQWANGNGKPHAPPGEYVPGTDPVMAEYTRVALEDPRFKGGDDG